VQPDTGFMLIDAWRAEMADPEYNAGAFMTRYPDPAGHRAGHYPAGGDRADDALSMLECCANYVRTAAPRACRRRA
jgi:hypothetical protein